MTKISDITVEDVKDSRQRPTIAVTVHAAAGFGTFAVPSGASTGSSEAVELRDSDGHMMAVMRNITEVIKPALFGIDVSDQDAIDRRLRELDGTPNKSHLGGNALIGVSIAAAKAAAANQSLETFEYLRQCADIAPSRRVPLLYANYINGGMHATSPLSFQEHMLVPDTELVAESMEMIEKVAALLEDAIRTQYGEGASASMGDEGGYVIPEADPHAPFRLLSESISRAGYDGRVHIAIDAAASSFYENGTYTVGGKHYTADQLIDLYREIASAYPIISIEDPFFEDSFDAFARLQSGVDARVVGDDLTVTNVARLQQAIDAGSIRALIIKPNQIGTLTEVFDTMKLARSHDIDCIVSHRSGETMDDFTADLAFAFGAFGLKAGALRKPHRRVKYERLAAISSR